MIVLGIDTSTPQTSVALGTGRELLAAMSVSAGRSNHELVTPAIEHVVEWSGASLRSIGGIAVGIGPGRFTSLRVGIATAKTLAQALRVPIIGVASLDALAFSQRHARRLIATALDARRGELFTCIYRALHGGVTRLRDFAAEPAGHFAAELDALGEEVLVVGDGAVAYRHVFEGTAVKAGFASPSDSRPQAACLIELSAPRFEREEYDRLYEMKPLYLRKSDAEIAWERRARTA